MSLVMGSRGSYLGCIKVRWEDLPTMWQRYPLAGILDLPITCGVIPGWDRGLYKKRKGTEQQHVSIPLRFLTVPAM